MQPINQKSIELDVLDNVIPLASFRLYSNQLK